MKQVQFANRAKEILFKDENVAGLAVAGSWISKEIDEFSDLDLIIVSRKRIAGDMNSMMSYAKNLGELLSGFTGEHVGEPRVLICLYDDPLLHVDIKFVTLDEFQNRIEDPVLLFDKEGQLQKILNSTGSVFPHPDHQWIEDRFWTWIHYALLKTGRGEYLEAFDFLSFLRMIVFGPLLHIRNNTLPRGVRKVEIELETEDLQSLLQTIPDYSREGILNSLMRSVALYRELRSELYENSIQLQIITEQKVMEYFAEIENRI